MHTALTAGPGRLEELLKDREVGGGTGDGTAAGDQTVETVPLASNCWRSQNNATIAIRPQTNQCTPRRDSEQVPSRNRGYHKYRLWM